MGRLQVDVVLSASSKLHPDVFGAALMGDVIAFSYPPYQFDAETPGTLVAPSQFFGQHGYVPAVQDIPANVNMRATFLAGGEGIAKGEVSARTIDLAPTLAFLLGIAETQQSQGRVLLDVLKPELVVYHCVDDIAAQEGIDSSSFDAAERRFAQRADVAEDARIARLDVGVAHG